MMPAYTWKGYNYLHSIWYVPVLSGISDSSQHHLTHFGSRVTLTPLLSVFPSSAESFKLAAFGLQYVALENVQWVQKIKNFTAESVWTFVNRIKYSCAKWGDMGDGDHWNMTRGLKRGSPLCLSQESLLSCCIENCGDMVGTWSYFCLNVFIRCCGVMLSWYGKPKLLRIQATIIPQCFHIQDSKRPRESFETSKRKSVVFLLILPYIQYADHNLQKNHPSLNQKNSRSPIYAELGSLFDINWFPSWHNFSGRLHDSRLAQPPAHLPPGSQSIRRPRTDGLMCVAKQKTNCSNLGVPLVI